MREFVFWEFEGRKHPAKRWVNYCFLCAIAACSSSTSVELSADGDATESASPDTTHDTLTTVHSAHDSSAETIAADVTIVADETITADETIAETTTDSASAIDAAEAAVSCSVSGAIGVCIDTADCTGTATPGYCPGPANIQCCTEPDAEAAAWCPTNPAARPNEGIVEAPGVGGCAPGMVLISDYCATGPDSLHDVNIAPASGGACPTGGTYGVAFCIDQYEACVMIKNADGTESSWSPYYEPPSGQTYRAVSLANAIPQGYISGLESQQACEASGKRLCDNTEWMRACRGLANNVYPYGNTRIPGRCNDESLHPVYSPEECFGTTASWIYSELAYAGINQQSNTVAKTGSFTGCVTAEGVYDLMGNMHDWVYDPLKATDPTEGVDFRGGYYNDTTLNGNGCLYNTDVHADTQVDYSVGFRCCADAP